MADQTTPPAGATPVVPGATPGQTPPPANGAAAPTPPATGDDAGLGDAGKRAIDAMKAERDAAQRAARAAEKALEELKLAGATDAEKAIAKARAEGAAEVEGRFLDQIRRSEVKVALTAAGISPSELALASKADEFAVLKTAEDGTVEGLDKAVSAFRAAHAGLFGARRATGSADGGAGGAGAQGGLPVFTRAQLRDQKFFAAHQTEILQAAKEGRIQG